jgi:hypothetical protein
LGGQYDKQVQVLEEKIRGLEEVNGQRIGLQQRELELLIGQLNTARGEAANARDEAASARGQVEELRIAGRRRQLVYWVILAVVAVICAVVGRGCR